MPEKIGHGFGNGEGKPKTPETEESNMFIRVETFLKPSEARETIKGFADAVELLSKEAEKAQAEGNQSRSEALSSEVKRLESIYIDFKAAFESRVKEDSFGAIIVKDNLSGHHSKFPITEKGPLGEHTYNATIFGVARSDKYDSSGENVWHVGKLAKSWRGPGEELYVPDDGNRETRERYYKSRYFTPEIIEAVEAAITRGKEATEAAIARVEKVIKEAGEEDKSE